MRLYASGLIRKSAVGPELPRIKELIQFESRVREARILNPLDNFELTTQRVEHRWDPLTRRTSIVIPGRMDYVKRFIESDAAHLDDLVQSTQASCPFCPSAILAKSPKFPQEIASEGRIQVGEAVCFPSLFAHNDYNAVIVPSPRHLLGLSEFTADVLKDGLRASMLFLERVHESRTDSLYPVVVMNCLPPAGSTISHFHMQALASDVPLRDVHDMLRASAHFKEQRGVSFWDDLVQTEKTLGARFLASHANVHWLIPYAPYGLNEAQAVVSGRSSIDQLTDADVDAIADGVLKVLRYYDRTGVRCFNGAFYSAPLGEDDESFSLSFRIASRYGYRARFVSDVWALQYLLGEREIYETPEETCLKLKGYFG
jgi:galactose-1-phosphate uridylyltransferase